MYTQRDINMVCEEMFHAVCTDGVIATGIFNTRRRVDETNNCYVLRSRDTNRILAFIDKKADTLYVMSSYTHTRDRFSDSDIDDFAFIYGDGEFGCLCCYTWAAI